MISLWEKINLRLHAIVDRALDARSITLYDQYVQDVQAYREQVEVSAATMYAGVQANKRRLAQYEEEQAALDGRVDELILDGYEEAARIAQGDLEAKKQLIATTRAQIANQEADHQRLLDGREQTVERLQVIRGERPAVESLLAVVRAGQLIEQIELSLGSLARLGQESGAGQIAAGILRRFDEAEARWQMATADLGVDEASVQAEKAQVDAQIQERIRRLGLDEA